MQPATGTMRKRWGRIKKRCWWTGEGGELDKGSEMSGRKIMYRALEFGEEDRKDRVPRYREVMGDIGCNRMRRQGVLVGSARG